MKNTSRRQFLKKSTIGMAGGLLATGNLHGTTTNAKNEKLPREVWIGTVSQEKMEVQNQEENRYHTRVSGGYESLSSRYHMPSGGLRRLWQHSGRLLRGDRRDNALSITGTFCCRYPKENHCFLPDSVPYTSKKTVRFTMQP